MDKIGKISLINQEIKKLEKLKEEIQDECKHKTTYIKFSETGGVPKSICKDCEKEIGYPTKDKLEKFLEK